jgi:lysyl-tRNA synthetase class 2
MPNDQREVRLQKLEGLRAAGMRPYADRYPTTHTLAAARVEAEKTVGTKVRVAGRIMTSRAFGQLTFAHLQDASGRCQIALDAAHVGAEALSIFDRLTDLGDFVGVEGVTFQTKKGEPTIKATSWTFLSKALLPLPEKWHGLSDKETCYRERHLDLLVNPETRERFRLRTRVVRALREYLDGHGFEEVETPVLAAKATGALARPFLTHHNALNIECALRIAPETWLKKCVAGGIDRVYEVARCFRNEGMDPSHLQDFTMCEWYCAYFDFRDNMDFTEGLILHLLDESVKSRRIRWGGNDIDFAPPWPRVKMRDLILRDSGVDYDLCPDAPSLRAAIAAKGIHLDRDDLDVLGRGPLIDVLYKKVSRPKLVSPVFVTNHPIDLSPLARRNDDNPSVTDRFQLVVNGWEIVNAYSELVDPVDQRQRFEEQMAARAAGDDEAMEIDEDYLRCMEHGMPPMSGWGMGIDRFVSLLSGQESLKDVVLFPLMKPHDEPTPSNAVPVPSGAIAAGVDAFGQPQVLRIETGRATDVAPEFALLGYPVDDAKDVGITPARARALFDEWVTTPSLRRQMEMTSAVMGALARKFGRHEEAWKTIGLLHNLDYDREKDPAKHCLVAAEALAKEGMHPGAIHAIAAHNDDGLAYTGIRCLSILDHALSCAEAVVGLVHATSQVLPSKDVKDVKASSVIKRFKDPRFAPTIERPLIARCSGLGLSTDDFLTLALEAVQGMSRAT